MDAAREMPKYQCHKKVWALKIRDICQNEAETEIVGGSWLIVPEDDTYAPFEVSHVDYVMKHKPKAGGYYVVYEDGYQSYSPAEAFESGYTKI